MTPGRELVGRPARLELASSPLPVPAETKHGPLARGPLSIPLAYMIPAEPVRSVARGARAELVGRELVGRELVAVDPEPAGPVRELVAVVPGP